MNRKKDLKRYKSLDEKFLDFDRPYIQRSRNISMIPNFEYRRGGKFSYAEWAHVIGIFQTLIYQNLPQKSGTKILDIGSGTGLMSIAAQPFISDGGSYTGIDVMKDDVEFCRRQYPHDGYHFIHFDVYNAMYAEKQRQENIPWPLHDDSFDLLTALSVWTHFDENDAKYYLREVSRVLKKGARAIITFFYLDEDYKKSLKQRTSDKGLYHMTDQQLWIFDKQAYTSEEWFTPSWTKNPEEAIGITPSGFDEMVKNTDLKLVQYYPGNWKEKPGLYFQDVMIFERK